MHAHKANNNKQQATSNKQQATSNKQQATSNKQQATSNKPALLCPISISWRTARACSTRPRTKGQAAAGMDLTQVVLALYLREALLQRHDFSPGAL
jgi:hypothetical protein